MTRPKLLDPNERTAALRDLAGWSDVPGRNAITKSFKFKTFAQAFAFMTEVASVAEAMDHHPEWTNVYNRVDVKLATHDAGGVTGLDTALAARMDEIAARSNAL